MPGAGPGSSPRGRGKPEVFGLGDDGDRLIPAWAGKTPDRRSGRRPDRAHPRVGGENPRPGRRGRAARGSSPRGRGKPTTPAANLASSGLIPAWAGKTARTTSCAQSCRAHPRVGGENVLGTPTKPSDRGSSPRGRGKLQVELGLQVRAGLIPAWAGKTGPVGTVVPSRGAHPRVGGENCWASGEVSSTVGSSPRGRGKHGASLADMKARRLIPAWAGKTLRCEGQRGVPEAHPRVGGENSMMRVRNGTDPGSSPRGRGKPTKEGQ